MKKKSKRSGTGAENSEIQDTELDLELSKFKSAKRSERRALIIVITLIVIFTFFLSSIIYFAGNEKTSQLSAYNDRWNDISKFREHIQNLRDNDNKKLYETRSILSSATMLNSINGDEKNYLYLAVGIEKEYSADEVKAIKNFVWDGGTVIIADDYGYGNSITYADVDMEDTFNIEFVGKPLYDEVIASNRNPRFIKINVRERESDFFEGVILLNDPTALQTRKAEGSWEGRVLLNTSDMGWIDMNNDGIRTGSIAGEETGSPIPIAQEVSMGYGKAVFISDPSIFINDMWDRENNSAFLEAMIKYYLPNLNEFDSRISEPKIIIFDESQHVQDDVFSNTRQSLFQGIVKITTDMQLAILVGILMLLFLGVLIIVVENPPNLRHRFNIDFYNLNQLLSTGITGKDCDRIRYIFLEHLRISHGLSVEEFKDLSYEELEDMIEDPELVEFALDWNKKYYGQDLEQILLKVRDYY